MLRIVAAQWNFWTQISNLEYLNPCGEAAQSDWSGSGSRAGSRNAYPNGAASWGVNFRVVRALTQCRLLRTTELLHENAHEIELDGQFSRVREARA